MNSNLPLPWDSVPLQTVQRASQILGTSTASIYRMAAQGRIQLVKLEGKTLVRTADLRSILESATPWKPNTNKTRAATRASIESRGQAARRAAR